MTKQLDLGEDFVVGLTNPFPGQIREPRVATTWKDAGLTFLRVRGPGTHGARRTYQDRIQAYREKHHPGWSHHPPFALALDGDQIIAMAVGDAAESPNSFELSVHVLPEYRRRRISLMFKVWASAFCEMMGWTLWLDPVSPEGIAAVGHLLSLLQGRGLMWDHLAAWEPTPGALYTAYYSFVAELEAEVFRLRRRI